MIYVFYLLISQILVYMLVKILKIRKYSRDVILIENLYLSKGMVHIRRKAYYCSFLDRKLNNK